MVSGAIETEENIILFKNLFDAILANIDTNKNMDKYSNTYIPQQSFNITCTKYTGVHRVKYNVIRDQQYKVILNSSGRYLPHDDNISGKYGGITIKENVTELNSEYILRALNIVNNILRIAISDHIIGQVRLFFCHKEKQVKLEIRVHFIQEIYLRDIGEIMEKINGEYEYINPDDHSFIIEVNVDKVQKCFFFSELQRQDYSIEYRKFLNRDAPKRNKNESEINQDNVEENIDVAIMGEQRLLPENKKEKSPVKNTREKNIREKNKNTKNKEKTVLVEKENEDEDIDIGTKISGINYYTPPLKISRRDLIGLDENAEENKRRVREERERRRTERLREIEERDIAISNRQREIERSRGRERELEKRKTVEKKNKIEKSRNQTLTDIEISNIIIQKYRDNIKDLEKELPNQSGIIYGIDDLNEEIEEIKEKIALVEKLRDQVIEKKHSEAEARRIARREREK